MQNALDIALKKTDVEALGIGKTNTSSVGKLFFKNGRFWNNRYCKRRYQN